MHRLTANRAGHGRALALALSLALSVGACAVGGCSDAEKPAAGSAAASSTGASSASGAPDAELDALLRGVGDCKIDYKGALDLKCPGAEALRQWTVAHQSWLDEDHRADAAAVGLRNLKNPSPAVRIEALALVARTIDSDATHQAALADLGKSEKDLNVLAAIAKTAGRAPEGPGLRELLLGLLANEDEGVRKAATEALVPTNGPPAASLRPSILSALKGASMDVKKKICQRLRVGDDPELAKAINALLDNASTPATLFDDCLYGLTLSWLAPEVKEPSKAAYEASLTCLEQCKRDDEHIGLGVSLMRTVLSPRPGEKPLAKWVDAARVEKAMVAIVKDGKAQPSLRFAAAMAFDDVDIAAKKSGLASKAIMDLAAKAGDPAAQH
ncbi:MAG TPA: hypothetical protein VL400_16420 [Polyangiaceae bacterium]|jgi:hypothetical protein|nr:hypothetical protein [Polyangiaceae bacterium]